MAFLDWIANWAEEHIPLVGGWIATLVRLIQGAIEGAYGWVKKAVSWIQNTWIPWAEGVIDSISLSLSNAWNRIKQYIEPTLDALSRSFNWIEDKVENLDENFSNFIRNLPTIVYNLIPDWIKDGVRDALDEISKIWSSLYSLWDGFSKWIHNAGSWFQEQLRNAKPIIDSWIHEVTDPAHKWIDWFKREFKEFISDPIGYIRSVTNPAISELRKEWNEFTRWADDKVKGFTDAVLGIDDFILSLLGEFIIGLIKWFIGTFIDDLAHLEYDPVEKKIYGKPKNPLTHILVWFFEVEKPENPYKSVKDKMGVEEVRGAEYARSR